LAVLARTGFTVANETYDVFVSYSRTDGRHAAEIDSILRDKGLKTFLDRRNLAPGLPWIRALEQAIGASKAAIVLLGPRGLGDSCCAHGGERLGAHFTLLC
jgi:TIR domain